MQNPLIENYLAGPRLLREAVQGMSDAELDAAPIPGKWTTRQVVCHLADFEPIYADRMKRIIAEERPTFFGGDPDLFAARLAYERRDVENELQMIEAVRRHLAAILRTLAPEDFGREGIHAEDGPIPLQTLLERITNHIPHHVRFIQEKRAALAGRERF
jgi:uncharacterized damage-inducible protein DinB